MSEVAITRTLPEIATEIRAIKVQAQSVLLFSSIEIGRRLVEAKALAGHGEWENWLKQSVDYSQRTAQNLMRIFQEYGSDQTALFGSNAKSQALADLSYTQAVALLGIPAEEREKFVEENPVDDMSTRELQKAVDQYKKLLDDANKTVNKVVTERDKAIKDKEAKSQELQEVRKSNDILRQELSEERKRGQDEVEKLKEKIKSAKAAPSASVGSGQIKKLEAELKSAEDKVKELTEKLNAPIEAAVVEKVPEETVKELEQLRNQVKVLQTNSEKQANPAVLKLSTHFEAVTAGFKNLLLALHELKASDPVAYEKYKGAVGGLIGKMQEKL